MFARPLALTPGFAPVNSAAELRAHYEAVRARLVGTPPEPIEDARPTDDETAEHEAALIAAAEAERARREAEFQRTLLLGCPLSERTRQLLLPILVAHRVPWRMLIEVRRDPSSSAARWEVFTALREVVGMTFPQIAAVMNRDASTVMHGVHMLKKRRQSHVA